MKYNAGDEVLEFLEFWGLGKEGQLWFHKRYNLYIFPGSVAHS